MALIHLGTATTNQISGFNWSNVPSASNLALLAAAIKNDKVNGNPVYPGAIFRGGILQVPNRGFLQVPPGDVIGVDNTGWPILISANSITNGSDWVRS